MQNDALMQREGLKGQMLAYGRTSKHEIVTQCTLAVQLLGQRQRQSSESDN